MRKNLLIGLLLSGMPLGAQQVVYFNNFNNGSDLSDWQVGDLDRDGSTWEVYQGSDSDTLPAGWDGDAGNMLGSTAYELWLGIQGPLDTDDLLVSPAIQLPDENCALTFKIGTHIKQLDDMTYQLFVLEDGQTWFPTLVPMEERKFKGLGVAQRANIDLSAFKGKKIRVYWRHYKSFGNFLLMLDDVEIKTTSVLSTVDAAKAGNSVYPNPVAETLFLKGFDDIKSYQVFNAAGQLVLSGKKATSVDVRQLSAGMYFITITDRNNASSTLKILKK